MYLGMRCGGGGVMDDPPRHNVAFTGHKDRTRSTSIHKVVEVDA